MADEKPQNEDLPENEQVEEEPSEFEDGKKKKSKIFYLAIFAVQIIVAIVLVKFFIIPWSSATDGEVSVEEEQEIIQEDEPKEIGTIYKLPALTVNPKGSRGRRFAVFAGRGKYTLCPERLKPQGKKHPRCMLLHQ